MTCDEAMRVYVLGSGSSGNALLVESCGTRVLIEAGVAPRSIATRLLELGIELRRGDLHGIIATHHHGDHFGHADKIANAFSAPLYLHPGLDPPPIRSRTRRDPEDEIPPSGPLSVSSPASTSTPGQTPSSTTTPVEVRRYEISRAFRIGQLTITTTQVPHDCTQIAIRVDDGRASFGVATDVGRVTPSLVSLLDECDAALVEANHCTEMLAFSEYPDVVKRRVGGGYGHLSNAQTAELAARLVGSRLARLWLGHLSRSNNTPARALEVVATRARRIDVDVIPATSPVALHVRSTKPYQLGLPF
jgi:phosphoribosyl 1,2-cyclic phosphodiesterase